MLYKSFLFMALLGNSAFAADTLDCTLARGNQTLQVQGEIYDGLVELKEGGPRELGLETDTTLSPRSYFTILNDSLRQQRLALSAAPAGLATEPTKLELGNASLSCTKNEEDPGMPIALPPRADYIHCVLDIVPFLDEAPGEPLGRITAKGTQNLQGVTFVNGASESAAFEVKFFPRDFLRGLEIKLTDKTNGETARAVGPANLMAGSFMLGFTQGDRKTGAKQLRLGCYHSDDPEPIQNQ